MSTQSTKAVDSRIRLGFVSDRSAYVDDSGVWVNSGVGRLVDAWMPACNQITVAMSLAPARQGAHDHRLDLPREMFLPLPWMPSIARGFHKAWACRRVLRELESKSDALVVQLPFAAPLGLIGLTKPRVFHICSNIWAMACSSPLYVGLKRMPIVAISGLFDHLQRTLIRRPGARVVANSSQLLAHFGSPAGRSVVSSSLRESEILSVRRSRDTKAPFRVLYVGYIRRAKGIDTLLGAFRELLAEVPDAELVIVGPVEAVDDGTQAQLQQELDDLALTATIRQIGNLEYGPKLFQQFADADVLALPSLSEGTPRVLVEARAFGCPVVASNVGGIPSSVQHGVDGLLVPPNDADAMSKALLRIIHDSELRSRLIAAGVARARMTTVEVYAQALFDEVLRAHGSVGANGGDGLVCL